MILLSKKAWVSKFFTDKVELVTVEVNFVNDDEASSDSPLFDTAAIVWMESANNNFDADLN